MHIQKYLSLFSGIGGFELGIGKFGQCIGYSEIDKYACQIYQRYFPGHKNYGDITAIKTSDLPDFDLLVAGFPCQPFSIAGKRRGFEDTRGTLFFEIARIVREKRPRLLLLENVKGLLSHGKGATFVTIITALDELGYDCQWQVLNSKNHGVPQNRERVFIVGHLRGTPRPEVFPFSSGDQTTAVLPGQQTTTITARYDGAKPTGLYVVEDEFYAPSIRQLNQPRHSNDRVYDPDGISPTLNTMQGGNRQPFVALTEKRTAEAKEIRRKTKGRDFSPRRAKYLAKRTDNLGNCITATQGKEYYLTNSTQIRRLTPTECERLQGFPDGWTDCVSDTQRYKALGNAVTVNVIQDICAQLLAI